MDEFKKWARKMNLLNEGSIILGIPQDNPETTSLDKCRYDTCIVIDNFEITSDEGVEIWNY